MPTIAIVYDRVNKFGGAEQVLLELHSLFPNAPLYTSVWDQDGSKWAGDWEIRPSFLQHLPFAKKHHEWFGWLMPLAFESLDLSEFDVVISVTSEAAKGVITSPNQLHICYCLTPTRYLWSHTHEYGKGKLGWAKRLIFSMLREWDYVAARRPDKIVAISRHVANRIEKYYDLQADAVIYPPVDTDRKEVGTKGKGNYFLVVSRLVPYKKIDQAIQACLRAQKNLVIVGTGSDEKRLKEMANGSQLITFMGFVDNSKLADLYVGATALVCPQEEDFGIVSVEAQSLGIPVISNAKSGMVETIRDGKTGVIYTDDLVRALHQAETTVWDTNDIQAQARLFDREAFDRHWKKLLVSYSVE